MGLLISLILFNNENQLSKDVAGYINSYLYSQYTLYYTHLFINFIKSFLMLILCFYAVLITNSKGKMLIKDKDKAWMVGLSNRAKVALMKNKYNSYVELYEDVMNEKIDLESFTGVGHKVAVEIRRWCISHS